MINFLNELSNNLSTLIPIALVALFKSELTNFFIGLMVYYGKEYNEGDYVLIDKELAKIEKIGRKYMKLLIIDRETYKFVPNSRITYLNIEFIPAHIILKILKKK